MTFTHYGVIGANGKTGRRVCELLTEQGKSVRALTRASMPNFDWHAPSTWADALSEIDVLYITYYPDLALAKAASDVAQLLKVAKRAGVQHLVLLSGRGEPGAQQAEQLVMNSGLTWNIVRASWFMQNFSESFMVDGIVSRTLLLPQAQALEPFIDADDIAEVVAKVMTTASLNNQLFEVTGPELLSFQQCVEHISDAIDAPVTYAPVSVADYLAAAAQQGVPDDLITLLQHLFTEVLDGRNASTTHTVEQLLGRPALTFNEYVKKTAYTGVWR
ncbi:NAD(P)H azoreductase [Marinomonas aquimarina]|uniref:NAD(P)H azoreductase n=1 Tax=Marinomonas aquimarina TaxID=295068 RepID=A0A1A8TPU1_9GAMM|nr:NAD(P)H-binding protein [Marinomonas aquimarina]SBS34772.1 NAD(P)H azoreductase [Marinomonas aquimarina]